MRDQLKVSPATVDVGVGSAVALMGWPALMVPAATRLAMSVRIARAMRTAPSMLSMPAPCSTRLAPARGWALYCRMALISGGVSPGLACSISATAPLTTGADTEVPLRNISVWPNTWPVKPASRPVFRAASRFHWPVFDVDAALTRALPGASRSGLSRLSTTRWPLLSTWAPRLGPRELKPLTTSLLRAAVSRMFDEPTVITDGSCPGEPTVPKVMLPAFMP